MSTFFDLEDGFYGPDSQFYFNVMVYEIGLAPTTWFEVFGDIEIEGMVSVKYLQYLTTARPRLYLFYPLNEQEATEQDIDFDITYYDHQVVEVNGTNIAWTDMIDFKTDDFWRLS